MTRLPYLAFALLFLACSSSTKTVDSPSELNGPVVTEDVGGLTGSPMIDPLETLRAAEDAGGLMQIPLRTAITMIDAYRNALAQRVGSEALTSDLEKLKTELSSPRIDGVVVGQTLQRLGKRTIAAAESGSTYETLGKALVEAGEGLH